MGPGTGANGASALPRSSLTQPKFCLGNGPKPGWYRKKSGWFRVKDNV